jgi:phage terminase large subunit-like protein
VKQIFAVLIALILGAAMFSEAKADRAVRFFEMLKHTDGEFYNQPFKLLDWERSIIRDVYGTVKENGTRQYKYVYVEIPKKNGKSELAAGAALYHLFADGEMKGEIYGCAVDKGQAGIVYEVARDMIDLVPALAKRAKVTESTRKITDRKSGSVYRVLSADAFRKHGYKVSACIFDELHAQPNRKLWDVMTFEAGATRRQPIWWVITTAGDDPDRVSIGWEQHEYAMKILSGEVIDPTWYVTIYNYDGEDIYNEANWFKANPSLGKAKSLDSMREAAATAKNKPENERLFRWLDLNQWITTKLTTWQPLSLFDQTVGQWDRADLAGRDCYIGIDLSTTTDLSSLCGIFPPQGAQLDWRVIWDPFIPKDGMIERINKDHVPYDQWEKGHWITATDGNVIDYTEIEKRILLWKDLYNVQEVPADRAFATMLVQRLEQAGLTVVDVPQTFVSLTDPMNSVETLLKTGAMTHETSPVARWCFGNTSIAKNGNEQIKYVKEHRGKSLVRTKRIDTTAAWVIAMARARFYVGKIDLNAKILSGNWGM